MRQVYAHQATLVPEPGTDPGATLADALPQHHVAVVAAGDEIRLRVLFAAEPDRVGEARSGIDAALAAGGWRVRDSGCTRLDPSERPHARGLLRRSVAR
ncbi:hypothetical protein [Actinoplanes derwentensis]|uniref:Uncharacterized protein n=1 Tax=Actinoplanes derwentensis TaxID=113562 RepID=A0A1H2DAF4_9ACTN|nr:hypothetical protein [Actinoplanes derwentensis]GID81745.1 hypothetical protein Ade03nite_06690 [Actinoplanes derwentensis]SDT79745.1 hypothetical protein SAMN04489716_8914 [Actinoplanes derwentensis]